MFFLLRMAFWIGLVLVLLPHDKTPDADKGPQVSAGDAVIAATAAVSDMSQFCTRQPTACAVGGQAASVLAVRVQAGAKKALDFIAERTEKSDKVEASDKAETAEKIPLPPEKPRKNAIDKRSTADKKNPDHTGSIDTPEEDPATPHDTLTPDDLAIQWQAASSPI